MKMLLLALMLLLVSCAPEPAKEDVDAGLILARLLAVQDARFVTVEKDGAKAYDFLAEQKKWGEQYNWYKGKVDAGDSIAVKYWLLMGFIADIHNDAVLAEAFSSDLVPVYEKKPEQVLGVLRELPFLLPSTGRYMNNHFGFEGMNADKKTPFIDSNQEIICRILGDELGNQFLSYFKQE